MPNFTIHELFTQMSGEVTLLDYRNKPDRNTWTIWDWLCALKDGITGAEAGELSDRVNDLKKDLFQITAAKRIQPPLTEQQLKARFGFQLQNIATEIDTLSEEHPEAFSQDELDLMTAAAGDIQELDSDDEIQEAQREVALQQLSDDAARYAGQMIEQRRAEENRPAPDRARLMSLTAQAYAAGYIRQHAQAWRENGGPAVFRGEDVRQFASQLLQDPVSRAAIEAELAQPLPQAGVQGGNDAYLQAMTGRVDQAAPDNAVNHNVGGRALTTPEITARLAILRDVKQALDATGTGYTWYWPSRRRNSTQYEDVRNEIQRQIDRLESGLSTGPADDQRMIQVLDAYSRGRENAHYDYAKVRQQNILRLYAEYTSNPAAEAGDDYPTAESVMQRYNDARGIRDPQSPEYVNLHAPAYSFQSLTNRAYQRQNELIEDLKGDLHMREIEGRPLDAPDQLALRQKFLRMAALHEIMIRDRANTHAPADEQRIQQEIARLESNPRSPILGLINAAVRNPDIMRDAIEAFEFADEQSQHSLYVQDPDHYVDPLQQKITRLSYPTVAERLEQSEMELFRMGPITEANQQRFAELASQIYLLRHLKEAGENGANAHYSEDELGQQFTGIQLNGRYPELARRILADTSYAQLYANALLNDELSLNALEEHTDRIANGRIDDMIQAARNEMRAIPANEALPDEDAKDNMRDKLVHIAALTNLRYDRENRFPNVQFRSTTLYSSEEIEAAENDVRENQPAFMQAIEPYLTDSNGVKQAFEDMASTRYARILEQMEQGMDNMMTRLRGSDEEQKQALDTCRTQFATLIALRNLQKQAGGLNLPIREEALQEEIARVRLSDEYLAADRMLLTSRYHAITLFDHFSHPETIDGRLEQMKQSVVAPEAANGTLGAAYQMSRTLARQLGDPATEEGRSVIALRMFRVMAYRSMMMEEPEGQYAKLNEQEADRRYLALATDPKYQKLLTRIRRDPEVAMRVANTYMNAKDPYTMKVEQLRAQAQNQPYEDPLPGEIDRLSALRYDEIYNEGLQMMQEVAAEAKAGVPLTGEQKHKLREAAAMMIISRRAPGGDVKQTLPEQERLRQMRELTLEENDASRNLENAIEKIGLDGGKVGDVKDMIDVSADLVDISVEVFSRMTPEKWAAEAWEKLQAAAAMQRENAWSEEEQKDLVQTYARMAAMSELARDPQRAGQVYTLAQVRTLTEDYLRRDNNLYDLTAAFRDPAAAVNERSLSAQVRRFGQMAPAQGQYAVMIEAANLQRMIAVRNLQKRYNADAILTDRQIQEEMAEVSRSSAMRILLDPRNNPTPPITARDLAGDNADIVLENAVYNSPARKSVLLGGLSENSFEGRRNLIADEMRHDNVLNVGKNAERLHIAELYALSLYDDGTFPEDKLPSAVEISGQAQTIADLPDFKTAMDALDNLPEEKEALVNALKNGAPAAEITASLNRLSQQQRQIKNPKDVRRSDLHYDIRAAVVQQPLRKLRSIDALNVWPTEQQAAAARLNLNAKKVGVTREEARELYLGFLASNRLYMRNPARSFFSADEIAAARAEVEQDPAVQADLETVLASPKEMRLNIFNLAPSQYWTEIQAMEEGRDVILNGPGGDSTKVSGMQVILFSLAPIVEARLNGNDISGRIVSNDDLAIERNRIAFSEEFITIENALRNDVNELDRIKDVLKLPADQFKPAFDKLTAEYKQKYPEAEIQDKATLAGDYLRAKEQLRAVQNADFANDEAARKQLAAAIREIMTIRDIILHSKYDVATKRNTVNESDSRKTNAVERAEAAGKYHLEMRLGKPGVLEEKLKDPQVAAQFLQIMSGAEDLRRLYGKKLAAGREIIDPLEQQILDRGLDAPVPSHTERQQTLINNILSAVPNETPQARSARQKQQIASLFNLVLHTAGTDPKDMPSDAVLAEQTQKILDVPDFGFAADRLIKDPQKLTVFMNRAMLGMTPAAMADELNRLSAEEQIERDPEADPHPNIIFRLRVNAMNAANRGMQENASQSRTYWHSNTERDGAKYNFMHYTAVNRLMAQHPDRMYFSETEINDSFLQAMNDEQLQQEFAQTLSGGPIKIRADLFSYGGGAFLTNLNMIEVNNRAAAKLNCDAQTKEAFLRVNLGQLGVIGWLQANRLVEQNHFTTTPQTDKAAADFTKTDAFKTLYTAAYLDPREISRISARMLPLNGDAFAQGLDQLVAEYRAPLNLAERSEMNRRLLNDYADVLKTTDKNVHRGYKRNLTQYLADTLNYALYKELPADQHPNAEEVIRQRGELTALTEMKQASEWLGSHPEELSKLAADLKAGMTATQILVRLNEAAIKYQQSEKVAHPASHIVFGLQRKMMRAMRDKYWSKCDAVDEWKEGEKEEFRNEFLDFTAMDALIKANPNRLFFSREEIRAARLPFEQNQEFMAKLEAALETPHIAREKICGFPAENTWNWTQQGVNQLETVQGMIKKSRNMSPEAKVDMMVTVMGCLAQAAATKIHGGKVYYEPSKREIVRYTDELTSSPEVRAMARALADNPNEMDRFLNELFPLSGDAFRLKLQQMGREYIKKYPKAVEDSKIAKKKLAVTWKLRDEHDAREAAQKKQNEIKPPVQPKPEVKPPVQPKPEVKPPVQPKPEVKQPAEALNRINIINEPEEPLNVIREEKIPQAVVGKLKPQTLFMPQKGEKNTSFGQYQNSAAQLEKTLELRAASKIPIDDSMFVDTAFHGILQTVAYLNLADKKEYLNQKVDKEALNAEVARLQNDKQIQPLKDAIRSGYGKTILNGIKHLEDEPKKSESFLRSMAADPAGTKKVLEQKYQRPAPKYRAIPALPKTEAVNDVIPKAPEGQKFNVNSPAGRYQSELNAYQTSIDTVKGHGIKSLDMGYNDTIHLSLLKLYALNQIMAGVKDPTAPIENLNKQIEQKANELNRNPGSYQYIIEGSKTDPRFRDHVADLFKNNSSFAKLNEKLQSNAEKYMHYTAKVQNDAVDRENSKMIRDARKDKDLNIPQV